MEQTEKVIFFHDGKKIGFCLDSKRQECLKVVAPELFVTLDCPCGYTDTLHHLKETNPNEFIERIKKHIKEVIQQN